MDDQGWLKDALVFLVVAGVVVPVFHRFRLGTVLGFIVAGIVVGPYGLGRLTAEFPLIDHIVIDDPDRVDPFAELGVVFLLFVLGLELSFRKLWEMRRYVLGVGSTQVAAAGCGLGLAAYLMGAGSHAAVVIGLALAMSSTAIVMQILVEQHRLASETGRISLSVLLMQDIMVVPTLVVVGILAAGAAESLWAEVGWALAKAVAAVAAILVAGRFGLRPLLQRAAMTGSRELLMAIVLVAVVGASMGTNAAGLSPELGAFLAGLLLAESAFRHQIEIDIEPFKGLLLGLFFTTVGMGINVVAVAAEFVWVAAAVAGLLAFKAAAMFAVCRVFGVAAPAAAETAILLAQGGEFALVVFGLAAGDGLLGRDLSQFLIVVVSLSMMATPFLAPVARAAAKRLEARQARAGAADAIPADIGDHVIVGGFGRVGQMVARVLDAEGVPYLALDVNAELVREHRAAGRPVFFGDAGRTEMLDKAGCRKARAVVVTVDAPAHAEHMVRAALAHCPGARVYARARDGGHALTLHRLGAAAVVPEIMEGSLQLAGRLLQGLDVPADAVETRLEREREREMSRLQQAAGQERD